MTDQHAKGPAKTLRDGALKATIWKREGPKGSFYSVDLARIYTDEQGEYHDSHSFSGGELLKIARLAEQAYDFTREARQAEA